MKSITMKLFLAFVSLSVGLTAANKTDNIILNGYAAYEGKAPYIVSLWIGTDGSNSGAVGDGTIIGNNWVITAAHCLTTDYVTIYYGSNWARKGQFSHTVRKENFIRHHLWPNTNNNIGLIRTPHVDFSSRINKVNLPKFSDQNNPMLNMWTVACGWGGMGNGNLDGWLQCMNVQIVSNEKCQKGYYYKPLPTASGVLCGRNHEDKMFCAKTSGGPLVTLDNQSLVGIYPIFFNDCRRGPFSYTRIASHLDWIRNNSGIAYY